MTTHFMTDFTSDQDIKDLVAQARLKQRQTTDVDMACEVLNIHEYTHEDMCKVVEWCNEHHQSIGYHQADMIMKCKFKYGSQS